MLIFSVDPHRPPPPNPHPHPHPHLPPERQHAETAEYKERSRPSPGSGDAIGRFAQVRDACGTDVFRDGKSQPPFLSQRPTEQISVSVSPVAKQASASNHRQILVWAARLRAYLEFWSRVACLIGPAMPLARFAAGDLHSRVQFRRQ